jgi:hypothetical protein
MKNLRQQNDFRFEKVGNKRLPDEGKLPISVYPVAVWKSAKFLVQAYAEKNDIIRLSVNIIKDREHIEGVHFKWKDGITWDELQASDILPPPNCQSSYGGGFFRPMLNEFNTSRYCTHAEEYGNRGTLYKSTVSPCVSYISLLSKELATWFLITISLMYTTVYHSPSGCTALFIKNAVGYQDRDAVEVYPSQTDVVNVSNMRHLWILPEKLDFAWRRQSA